MVIDVIVVLGGGEGVGEISAWVKVRVFISLHAPVASKEASVMMEKGWVMSGIRRTGADEKMCLRRSNACCWSWVHTQGSPLRVSRLRGATMLEKSRMNFL